RKPHLPIDDPEATPSLVLQEGSTSSNIVIDSSTLSASRAVTPTSANPRTPAIHHPRVSRKLLKPGSDSVWAELCLFSRNQDKPLTEEEALELEAQLLVATEEPLCLDPSVQVTRISNATEFVSRPQIPPTKRRKFNSIEIEAEEAARKENHAVMLMMDDRHHDDFQPSFNRLLFIQEWRKLQLSNRTKPPPPVVEQPIATTISSSPVTSKKSKSKKGRLGTPDGGSGSRSTAPLIQSQALVYEPMRTLRFEQTINDKKRYTVLHVYHSRQSATFKCVLREGDVPDTSINGTSQEFTLDNQMVLDTYITNFIFFYGMQNRLVFDSAEKPTKPESEAMSSKTSASGNGAVTATPKNVAKTLATKEGKLSSPKKSKKSKKTLVSTESSPHTTPELVMVPATNPLGGGVPIPVDSGVLAGLTANPLTTVPPPLTRVPSKSKVKGKGVKKSTKSATKPAVSAAGTLYSMGDTPVFSAGLVSSQPTSELGVQSPTALPSSQTPTPGSGGMPGGQPNLASAIAMAPALHRSPSVASNPMSSPHLMSPGLPIRPSPMASPAVVGALARKISGNPAGSLGSNFPPITRLNSSSPHLLNDAATFPPDSAQTGGPAGAVRPGAPAGTPAAANPPGAPTGGLNPAALAQLQAMLMNNPLFNYLVANQPSIRNMSVPQQLILLQKFQQSQLHLRQQQRQQQQQASSGQPAMQTAGVATFPGATSQAPVTSQANSVIQAMLQNTLRQQQQQRQTQVSHAATTSAAATTPMAGTASPSTGTPAPTSGTPAANVLSSQVEAEIQTQINRGNDPTAIAVQYLAAQGKSAQNVSHPRLQELGLYLMRHTITQTLQKQARAASSQAPLAPTPVPSAESSNFGQSPQLRPAASISHAGINKDAVATSAALNMLKSPTLQAQPSTSAGANFSQAPQVGSPNVMVSQAQTVVNSRGQTPSDVNSLTSPQPGAWAPTSLPMSGAPTSGPTGNAIHPSMVHLLQGNRPPAAPTSQAAAAMGSGINPDVKRMLAQMPPQVQALYLEHLSGRANVATNDKAGGTNVAQSSPLVMGNQANNTTAALNPNAMAAARSKMMAYQQLQQLQNQIRANQMAGRPIPPALTALLANQQRNLFLFPQQQQHQQQQPQAQQQPSQPGQQQPLPPGQQPMAHPQLGMANMHPFMMANFNGMVRPMGNVNMNPAAMSMPMGMGGVRPMSQPLQGNVQPAPASGVSQVAMGHQLNMANLAQYMQNQSMGVDPSTGLLVNSNASPNAMSQALASGKLTTAAGSNPNAGNTGPKA
ncbi:Transcription factor spt20, partial [Dispira parvispora]